jgi:pyrroloquinoline quinone biosynthesis protein B
MIVRILGAAAGGGYPQWNCYCGVCLAARAGPERARPRTQSSLAFRAPGRPWYLVNASPDLRQQIADLPLDHAGGGRLRATPFAAILLTDAEIDHTAGLLLMRESDRPLRVYSTRPACEALSRHYPVLTILSRYCGVEWGPLEPGEPLVLDDDFEVEPFATGGDPPLYAGDDLPELVSVGLTIRDRKTGGVLTYAPALETIDAVVAERLSSSDCAAVDGTFWERDELVSLGLAERDALAMGHMPISGPSGSMAALAGLEARTIFVHINNTNPILLEDSPERSIVARSGIDVAWDGMEVTL